MTVTKQHVDTNNREARRRNRHVTLQRRYEFFGAMNDLLIAMWFLLGSIFFLNGSLERSGTWLFIVGSAQLLIKPMIKLIGLYHTRRMLHHG